MYYRISIFFFIVFALLIAGCRPRGSGRRGTAQAAGLTGRTVENSQGPAETCPVTLPPDPPFVPPPPYPPEHPYGGFWFGSEELWTGLPVDGTWRQLAFGDKVFWWRQGYIGSEEPQSQLSVSGRRLDVLEKPIVLAGAPATNAYHPDFHWAMLNGFGVPAPGCWEITGHYEGHELRFVVWIAP